MGLKRVLQIHILNKTSEASAEVFGALKASWTPFQPRPTGRSLGHPAGPPATATPPGITGGKWMGGWSKKTLEEFLQFCLIKSNLKIRLLRRKLSGHIIKSTIILFLHSHSIMLTHLLGSSPPSFSSSSSLHPSYNWLSELTKSVYVRG